MLTRLRKFTSRKKGQAAIILIMLTALALIFYAVSLNLGRLSQLKLMTTVASNSGASVLASQMASYGQSVLKNSLGGDDEKCGWSGIFSAILAVVLAAIALALVLTGPGATVGVQVMAWAAAILSAVNFILQVAVIQPGLSSAWNSLQAKLLTPEGRFVEQGIQAGLQTLVTDQSDLPDLTDMDQDSVWGMDGFVPKDSVSRFTYYYNERMKKINQQDTGAMDEFLAGLWEFVFLGRDQWGLYDPIGCENGCCYDSVANNIVPSECNVCCVPGGIKDIAGKENIRPSCCNQITALGEPSCGTSATCEAMSPYGDTYFPPAPGSGPGFGNAPQEQGPYAFVYDPFLENFINNADGDLSFRELLGRDDEHRYFHRDPDNVNAVQQIPEPHFYFEDPGFYVNDATGYSPQDKKPGVFPFFYKIADWGIDLNNLTLDDPDSPHCHWCDPRDANCSSCSSGALPEELEQLNLKLDPQEASSGILFNTTLSVDGINQNRAGDPPLAVDRVTRPENILAGNEECAEYALDSDDESKGFWKRGGDRFCNSGDPSNISEEGLWPYYAGCEKYGSSVCRDPDNILRNNDICLCGQRGTDPELWPDDPLDELVYGLNDFIEWSAEILKQSPTQLRSSFTEWYTEAAQWIEPPDGTKGVDCFECDETTGYLHRWRDKIQLMKNRLYSWRDTSFAGESCQEVWCAPPDEDPDRPGNACPGIPPSENVTFDWNNNTVQGDLEDVIQCLNYNVNGFDPVGGPEMEYCLKNCSIANCRPGDTLPLSHSLNGRAYFYPSGEVSCNDWGPEGQNEWYHAIEENLRFAVNDDSVQMGNDERFKRCSETCSFQNCSSLPRSLIPQNIYDPAGFVPGPDQAGSELMLRCLNSCSLENCSLMPRDSTESLNNLIRTRTSGSGRTAPEGRSQSSVVTYSWHSDPAAFSGSECDNWDSDNPWIQDIMANTKLAGGPMCDMTPPSSSDNLNGAGWLYLTYQSHIEAVNQVEKFRHRRDFLQKRLEEIDKITKIFQDAEDKFEGFLTCEDSATDADEEPDGPACQLIQERINFAEQPPELPNYALYAWKDEQDPDKPGTEYWHAVRVDARIPKRCDNACGFVDGLNSPDPEWPKVKTRTKKFGTRRCYYLSNRDGLVKYRATRYDENRDSRVLRFPNGTPIWDFQFFHPERPVQASPDLIEQVCRDASVVPQNAPGQLKDLYEGAFILTKREENPACWDLVNKLLAGGVTSETCAHYYFHSQPNKGMGFQFVNCPRF